MIRFSTATLKKTTLKTVVIPVCEDQNLHTDRTAAALAKKALAVKEFKAEAKDELVWYNPPRLKVERVVFLGLGKEILNIPGSQL